MQCSGSQDSFTVDHYCGGGGGGDTQAAAAAAAAAAASGAAAAAAAASSREWSGASVTPSGGIGGMCQHHGLTSQSLMSGGCGSHMSLLGGGSGSVVGGGSSGSSGMSGSGVGSSGQGIPISGQCSAAADVAMLSGGHCRSMSGLSSLSMSAPPCPPPPALFNPCSSALSLQQAASSRWGPRTSCPVHSPFRVRVPNGSICSGHQVSQQRTRTDKRLTKS